MTVHLHSAVLRNFNILCGLNEENNDEIPNDENDVSKIIQVITDKFGNLFTISASEEKRTNVEPLINISTGAVATEKATKALFESKKIGKSALETYGQTRLNENGVPLTTAINRLKLQTFATMQSKRKKETLKLLHNNQIESCWVDKWSSQKN